MSRSPLASTVLQPPRERGGRGPTHPPLTHRPQLCSCAVGSGYLLRLSGARAGGHETRSGAETQRTTFWPPPGSDKRARLGRQEHVVPPMDGEDRGVNARGILYLLSALACQRVASNGKNHNPRSALARLLARPGHSRVDLGRPGGPVQIALGEHVRFSALFQIGAVFGYVILGK